MSKLNCEYTFADPEPFSLAPTFPVTINSVNEDGSVQGYFDLNRMSSGKKFRALSLFVPQIQ